MEASNICSESEKREGECRREIKGSLENVKSINDLPVEMLTMVFGYLTHTQKLIARLVCTHWNKQISNIFKKQSYFAVSSKSFQVILDSEVEWMKIILSYTLVILANKSWSSITTLRVELSGLSELMKIVVEFPHLTSLELNIVEYESQLHVDCAVINQGQDLKVRFQKIMGKLKILSVTIDLHDRNFATLYGFLKELDAETMVLTELKIRQVGLSYVVDDSDPVTVMLSEVKRIISKSSRTLLFLHLGFCTAILNVQLFPEVISKLTDLKELKLISAWIQIGCGWMNEDRNGNSGRNFLIHKEFLLSQMDAKSVMKNVSLPWSPNPASCEEFIHSLPQGIESVQNVDKTHNMNEYISRFTKLKRMTLHSNEVPTFSHLCPSITQLSISNLEELEQSLEPATGAPFYTSLGTVFTNLVELHIEQGVGFREWSLQLVIQHLNKLRTLHIRSANYIHDFGVTGIEDEYSDVSLVTGKLHLYRPVPKEKIVGLPLNSLRMLEKLVIIDASISDFGIYYGLQFGSTLKHLTIHSNGKISDWGLHWLGAGNPCLESFDGSFMSKRISDEGPDILREQFPLIKSTRKFKVGKQLID